MTPYRQHTPERKSQIMPTNSCLTRTSSRRIFENGISGRWTSKRYHTSRSFCSRAQGVAPLAAKRDRNAYGSANNTTAHPDDGYPQQEAVGAITNLATSMARDCTAIAQLMATVERIMAELVTVNTKLVAALQLQRAIQGGHGGRSHGRGASATTTTLVPPTGTVSATRTDNQDLEPPIHYCWT